MKLKDIIAISGKPGLFEIKAQSGKGLIVKSLTDDKKIPVNITHNISALNEIAIYTYEEEVPLRTIFKSIFEKESGKAISHKESNDTLINYFREVVPNFDEERVYVSNIKKVLQWYNLLADQNFDFASIKEEEDEEASENS